MLKELAESLLAAVDQVVKRAQRAESRAAEGTTAEADGEGGGGAAAGDGGGGEGGDGADGGHGAAAARGKRLTRALVAAVGGSVSCPPFEEHLPSLALLCHHPALATSGGPNPWRLLGREFRVPAHRSGWLGSALERQAAH